ncbi:MAG TPA: alpha/beta hydrolase, partial [Kofleriaceae bacterium]
MDLNERESREVEQANASGKQPIVFVHGLWLLASSWDRWRAHFSELGYTTVAPGWPDDPATVEEARAHPEVFANKSLGVISDHYERVIKQLKRKPAIIGHSFGGVLVQMLAGKGLAATTVAIDPAPFRGVLPLPFSSLKSAAPVLANPANLKRAVALTWEQFNYGWTNNLPEAEGKQLYEEFHVAGSGLPLFQAALSNVNPWTEDKVDTKNPDRGPLLFISGDNDHTVPWAIVHASYERQKRNTNPTEIIAMEKRGHSLVIDSGWKAVADLAVEF